MICKATYYSNRSLNQNCQLTRGAVSSLSNLFQPFLSSNALFISLSAVPETVQNKPEYKFFPFKKAVTFIYITININVTAIFPHLQKKALCISLSAVPETAQNKPGYKFLPFKKAVTFIYITITINIITIFPIYRKRKYSLCKFGY